MKKDPRVYLAHILECAEKIERFTRGGREEFLREELIQDAVIRNVEIIGEAAKRVDEEYRATHSHIPWRGMAALRDVLIHQRGDRTRKSMGGRGRGLAHDQTGYCRRASSPGTTGT